MPEEEKAAAEAAAQAAAEKAAADKAKADQEAADCAAADDASKKDADDAAAKAAEVADLQAQLAAAKAEAAKFNGLDPEAARAAIAAAKEAAEKAAELEEAKAKAEGNFEKLRELQQAETEAAVKAAEEAKAAALAEAQAAREELVKAKIETAFANSKFLQEETILSGPKAQRLFSDHVEVEDGKVVVYDKPAGTAGRAKVMDTKGNALPFNDAIKKVIEADADKDAFLKTKTTPGAGSKTTDGKPSPGDKSRHERLKEGLAKLRGK